MAHYEPPHLVLFCFQSELFCFVFFVFFAKKFILQNVDCLVYINIYDLQRMISMLVSRLTFQHKTPLYLQIRGSIEDNSKIIFLKSQ